MKSQPKKLEIIGGLDDERAKLSTVNRQNLQSFAKRVEIAKGLEDQALTIEQNKGFLVCSPDTFDTKDIITECLQKYDEFLIKKLPRTSKGFLTNNLYLPNQMAATSAFIKFAKHPKVLATISKYLGHLPILQYVGAWHSTYMPGEFRSSQLFHCDWEDVISSKIFINLNDVNTDNGSLYALDAITSKDIRKKISYTFSGPGYRVSDETILSNMTKESELINFSGPPGTVSFVDTTRCFHYGSRMQPNTDRLVAVISYLSPAALNISRSKLNSYKKFLANNDSEIEKYLFGHIW